MEETLKEYDVITEYHKTFKAHSHEEAEEMAYGINVETEWNRNSVFCDEAELCADGTPFDIKAELIDNED